MTGTNILKINQATMREALTQWLNDRELQGRSAVEVTSVQVSNDYFVVAFIPKASAPSGNTKKGATP